MSEATTHAPLTTSVAKRFALEEYLAIIRYRKWLLIVPMVVLTIVTLVASMFMDNIYRAQTTILVSGGDVSEAFVPSAVTNDVEDRVKNIREQILSETLLLNVIQTYELFPDMANGPTEDRVTRMRNSVKIELQGKDIFRVSFVGKDPLTVQNVTNRLAQMFINETYGDRQKSAAATAEFLAQRLAEVKEKLDAQEDLVAQFKRKHIGKLPEQMEANQRTLDRLGEQLQSLGEQIASAEDRKVMLETQMAQLQGALMATGTGDVVTAQEQLENLQARLNQMQQTLTDEHPDVIDLKSKIARLQAEIGTEQTVGDKTYQVTAVNRPLFDRLQQTNLQIRSLAQQRSSVMGQIANLSGRVAEAPEVEQELSLLERDLEKMRESYQDIQKKHMDAKQSEELEAQQKGRQFKIIDEARYPERPFKPNRGRLTGLAFAIGLMVGLMTIFITEHLDHSIRDSEDLAAFTGQKVVATIPRFTMHADQEHRAKIIKLAIAVAAAAGFLLLAYIMLKVGFDVDPFASFRK